LVDEQGKEGFLMYSLRVKPMVKESQNVKGSNHASKSNMSDINNSLPFIGSFLFFWRHKTDVGKDGEDCSSKLVINNLKRFCQ
jgi:hypothetical protein